MLVTSVECRYVNTVLNYKLFWDNSIDYFSYKLLKVSNISCNNSCIFQLVHLFCTQILSESIIWFIIPFRFKLYTKTDSFLFKTEYYHMT
jgi:hypothetical protein